MIDASHVKVHPHAAGAVGGNEAMALTKGAKRAKGAQQPDTFGRGCAWLPLRVIITDGPTADCTQAAAKINGMSAQHLLADKGYDTDAIVAQATAQKMSPVIPPKSNRIVQRECYIHIYKSRHLVENAFLALKGWRGVATRYAKKASSLLAIVQIRCVMLWICIL